LGTSGLRERMLLGDRPAHGPGRAGALPGLAAMPARTASMGSPQADNGTPAARSATHRDRCLPLLCELGFYEPVSALSLLAPREASGQARSCDRGAAPAAILALSGQVLSTAELSGRSSPEYDRHARRRWVMGFLRRAVPAGCTASDRASSHGDASSGGSDSRRTVQRLHWLRAADRGRMRRWADTEESGAR